MTDNIAVGNPSEGIAETGGLFTLDPFDGFGLELDSFPILASIDWEKPSGDRRTTAASHIVSVSSDGLHSGSNLACRAGAALPYLTRNPSEMITPNRKK